MSWLTRKKQRELLAGEINLCPQGQRSGGRLRVCLVYPNSYRVGMGSLGFQTVYSLISATPDVVCERAFLPEKAELAELRRSGETLASLESNTPLSDFDMIAFSTSFEPDYLNIPIIIKLIRIPVWSAQRNDSHPLIIAGGAAFMINPEPVADFLDLICIGDGEEIVPKLLKALLELPQERDDLFRALAKIQGIYIPALITPSYQAHKLTGFERTSETSYDAFANSQKSPLPPGGGGLGWGGSCHYISQLQLHPPPDPLPSREGGKAFGESINYGIKQLCSQPERHEPAQSVILSENAEFGEMFLVEVSRGCPRVCRFCTSGFAFGQFRQQSYEKIVLAISEGLKHRNKIGLVGAAVSDHRDIGRICRFVVEQGAKVSVSSLRIDRLNEEMLDALVASGHKTIALAPEGGSQKLRDLMRKNLTEQQILDACEMLISRDILNLKLYFIIGLPTETVEDLDEMIQLVASIQKRVIEKARENRRLGEIVLSVNPFIPKPFTPFQWCGMEPLPALQHKVKMLESAFRGMANVRLKVEGLRDSYFQALVSRGDRGLSRLLALMADGASLKKGSKACGIDSDMLVERTIPLDELLPWSVIGEDRMKALRNEFEQVFS